MVAARRRRGFALLLAMGTISLLILGWGLASHQAVDLLRLREARDQAADRVSADSPLWAALARGLAQLETGDPPAQLGDPPEINPAQVSANAWVYAVSFGNPATACLIRYEKGSGSNWTVTATYGTGPVPLPTTFRQPSP
ncbi:MAG: hypothetical protein U0800_05110 [Isosphaeraceae bacterium]